MTTRVLKPKYAQATALRLCPIDAMPRHVSERGVLVLGVFRSGTSLVCQLLYELGVNFGPAEALGAADRYNPGGYFERTDVVHANNLLLESAGRSFAEPGDASTLASEGEPEVLRSASLDFASEPGIWGVKDPRFCVTLGAWVLSGHLNTTGLRVIHVHRDVEQVVRSATAYPGVNCHFGFDVNRIRRGVHMYDQQAHWQVKELGLRVFDLDYAHLQRQPKQVIRDIAELVECTDERRIRGACARVGRARSRGRYLVSRVCDRLFGTKRTPSAE